MDEPDDLAVDGSESRESTIEVIVLGGVGEPSMRGGGEDASEPVSDSALPRREAVMVHQHTTGDPEHPRSHLRVLGRQ